MRVEGIGYTFDFTHVADVVRGIGRVVDLLDAGRNDLPPIHLASGRATTLGDLARMANAAGGGRSRIDQMANRAYNVSCFIGDPNRASEILGWRAEVPIEAGVRQLVADSRAVLDETPAAGRPTGGLPYRTASKPARLVCSRGRRRERIDDNHIAPPTKAG